MPKVTYVEHNGIGHTVDVPVGTSVMRGAVETTFRHRRGLRRRMCLRDLPCLYRCRVRPQVGTPVPGAQKRQDAGSAAVAPTDSRSSVRELVR